LAAFLEKATVFFMFSYLSAAYLVEIITSILICHYLKRSIWFISYHRYEYNSWSIMARQPKLTGV